VKDVQYAAMAVESRHGSDDDSIASIALNSQTPAPRSSSTWRSNRRSLPPATSPSWAASQRPPSPISPARPARGRFAAPGIIDHRAYLQCGYPIRLPISTYQCRRHLRRRSRLGPGEPAGSHAQSISGIEHVRRLAGVGLLPAPRQWRDLYQLHLDGGGRQRAAEIGQRPTSAAWWCAP